MADYYDINAQIWAEDDVIYYSVIQEHAEDDVEPETLVYGEANSFEEALAITRDAVMNALK